MKMMTKAKKEKPALHSWSQYPEETEITYVFVATDERYGIFNLSLRSKKRVPHADLSAYLDEGKKLIDLLGSPGLSEWGLRMEKRGFRMVPSTAVVLDDVGVTSCDCVPRVEKSRRPAGARS